MWFLREIDLLDALHLSILQSSPEPPTKPRTTSFVEKRQLEIGLRATKPMSAPSNRVIWKHDRRVDIPRNSESNAVTATDSSTSDTLLKQIEVSPSLLEKSESLETLTNEIGVSIYRFMLQPIEEIDVRKRLMALGVDSLVTIEVRNWLGRRMAIEISTLEILNGGTIGSLGVIAVERLKERFEGKEFAVN